MLAETTQDQQGSQETLPTTSTTSQEQVPTKADPQELINAVKAELSGLYQTAINEKHAKIMQLEQKLSEFESQLADDRRSRVAVEEPGVSSSDWLADPDKYIGKRIEGAVEKALAKTIAPLQRKLDAFAGQSEYGNLKVRMKSDPRLTKFIDDNEAMIDGLMQGQPPTDQAFHAALRIALGENVISGRVPATTTLPPTRTEPDMTPPHTRPTPPAAPRAPVEKKELVLTETERKVARIQGLTDEQYVAMRDADADVTTWPRPAAATK